MNDSDDRERISNLRWFHSIDFGAELVSSGEVSLEVLNKQADIYFKKDITGLSVLDVGAWDGFNSFEAKRRGASHVLATDYHAWSHSDRGWGDKACFDLAKRLLTHEIDEMIIDIPDINIDTVGQFDIVLFLGVFYHLKELASQVNPVGPPAGFEDPGAGATGREINPATPSK